MMTLDSLMTRLGYTFQNTTLLEMALTHRSYGALNNERLEFLGDSVLGFLMTDRLYRDCLSVQEGDLSRMRALLVNGDRLAELASHLGISEHLRLGVGEQRSGGRRRHSILADALEAIVGAIYIDGGFERCQQCVFAWYEAHIPDFSQLSPTKDAKSRLQEWLQARSLPLPVYEVTVRGEAHAQTFSVTCKVHGLPHLTSGEGSTRRRAEQVAAEHFLELLNE